MEYTIRDLLSAIFRHMRALVVFWIVALLALVIFYTQTLKLYDSKAKVLVSLGSESSGKAVYLNEKNIEIRQREQQIHDEQEILDSHDVLLTTARWIVGDPTPGYTAPERDWRTEEARRFLTGEEPEPTLLLRGVHEGMVLIGKLSTRKVTHEDALEDMVRSMSKALTVNLIFDSDALDVTYRYRDPRVAQTVLSLILESYVQHHIDVFRSGAENMLLKAQSDDAVRAYNNKLAEFSAYMTAHGVYTDDTQLNTLMEQRTRLTQNLNQAVADEAAVQAQIVSLRSIDHSLGRFENYSTTEVRNKERDRLLNELNQAILDETAVLNRHPEGSRAYQEQRAKLDKLKELVNEEPKVITDQTEQRRSKASELVESDMISATEAHRADEARVHQARTDLKLNDLSLSRYASGLKGFDALKEELVMSRQASEQLGKAYMDSHLKSLTSASKITDVSIIDGPTWDYRQASPKKQLVALAAIALLLIGSVALLIGSVMLDETLPDPRTAKMRMNTEVVAALPIAQEGNMTLPDDSSRFEHDNHAQFARIYQSIRNRGANGGMILIAESTPGEGATTVGLALARFISSYAREKTVFVDRTKAGVEESTGAEKTSDGVAVLNRTESAQDVIALMDRLRRDYTTVVLASGAVKDATDLLSINNFAPTAFLVVEAGKTRRASVRYSLDMLQRYGFQNVGIILNKRKLYIPSWLMRFV